MLNCILKHKFHNTDVSSHCRKRRGLRIDLGIFRRAVFYESTRAFRAHFGFLSHHQHIFAMQRKYSFFQQYLMICVNMQGVRCIVDQMQMLTNRWHDHSATQPNTTTPIVSGCMTLSTKPAISIQGTLKGCGPL